LISVFRWIFTTLLAVLIFVAGVPLVEAATSSKGSSAPTASKRKPSSSKKRRRSGRPRGQQAIARERAREIQEALIRAKYLDGKPSGVWDQRTKNALVRYQGDNGWQTKIVPDSRALIKLGLGPNYASALNAQNLPKPSAGSAAETATAASEPAQPE
jgi:hypothetical protein